MRLTKRAVSPLLRSITVRKKIFYFFINKLDPLVVPSYLKLSELPIIRSTSHCIQVFKDNALVPIFEKKIFAVGPLCPKPVRIYRSAIRVFVFGMYRVGCLLSYSCGIFLFSNYRSHLCNEENFVPKVFSPGKVKRRDSSK